MPLDDQLDRAVVVEATGGSAGLPDGGTSFCNPSLTRRDIVNPSLRPL
ncbi:MAG: hypothetical protein JO290_06995 [Sphingomonadaceae bacterium]|nr:hypothetical protein [Sphingomonadaceae bacterium]